MIMHCMMLNNYNFSKEPSKISGQKKSIILNDIILILTYLPFKAELMIGLLLYSKADS